MINIVTFSDTINVFTPQRDGSQRKTQEFIGPIEQKIGFIFLLSKSSLSSSKASVNTERGVERRKDSPHPSNQATSLFPPNSHRNFGKLLSKGTPRTRPHPPQTDLGAFKSLLFQSVTQLVCVLFFIICFMSITQGQHPLRYFLT